MKESQLLGMLTYKDIYNQWHKEKKIHAIILSKLL